MVRLSTVEQVRGPLVDLLAQGSQHTQIDQVLGTLRKHLGMDVAFVSRFREFDRVLEVVNSEGTAPIAAGDRISLEEGYCRKIVCGDLPQLIPDTSIIPTAMAIPATTTIPIGSHLSVPIMLIEGQIYGTLCCFNYQADPTLGARDLRIMHAFAEVLAHRIQESQTKERVSAEQIEEIRRAIKEGGPRIVYQPLYALEDGEIHQVECLSRFDVYPSRTPDKWFEMAHRVGIGLELELVAIQKALLSLDALPQDVSIGLNSSPELITSGRLIHELKNAEPTRIVIEITEHATVADYSALTAQLKPLRDKGVRLAIDDAGAGYASMRHILSLSPDLIKLDMSLTRNIDSDLNKRALARALISFARDIGSRIVAEGVETAAELDMLRSLGVHNVQGYYLSKPLSLPELMQLQASGRKRGLGNATQQKYSRNAA